ncbi:MAG: NAD-dependent deacetylase [Bacteroidetes bacterium 4572_117]|nr:MAG: NAD-dependent deacetylase [Bacteroidetes bacterium 4572_117]
MDTEKNIKKAAEAVKNADAILITAGAGIGVDSGLPDFRGNSGFWKAYPPIAKLGKSFSEMANPVWFDEDPQIAWAFYGHRLNLYRETIPHAGFEIMLDWAKNKTYGYYVYTSNVDGQFQKAGFDDEAIDEVHGSIHHFQCIRPCTNNIWDASDIDVNVDLDVFEAVEPLPRCPSCGAIARPNILMFGDWNWISDRSSEQSNSCHNWLDELKAANAKLVIIELGAGHAVPTVRMKSQSVFRSHNAEFIRINPRDHKTPDGGITIPLGSKEAIERIAGYIR